MMVFLRVCRLLCRVVNYRKSNPSLREFETGNPPERIAYGLERQTNYCGLNTANHKPEKAVPLTVVSFTSILWSQ